MAVTLSYPVLSAICLLSLIPIALHRWVSSRKAAGDSTEEATGKQLNEKTHRLPDPEPLNDLDLKTAQIRNHIYANKTLRHPYFQTMAHQPMNINHWIEIDKDIGWYIDEKTRVIKEQGKTVVDSLPENDDACAELLEILVDYLPKRYPTLFEHIGVNGIWNKITGERFHDLTGKSGVDALVVISRLVQDDFLMGREREDGHVYFVGGLVAFPGFYLLSNYIDKPLEEIHRHIPYFNEKILKSVERTLKRFGPHEPFERTSWGVVDDRNLFCHKMIAAQALSNGLRPEDLWLRMDHQTFRKLPRSGGIAFGVHVVLKRLEDLAESPVVPALLAKIHLEADKELMHHKFDGIYRDRMMPYLQELTKRQLEQGLITEEDLDRVQDFRDLIKGGQIPDAQTTLSQPTLSEIEMSKARAAA